MEYKKYNFDGYYAIKMRHHYGSDMHDFYTLVVDSPQMLKLKQRSNQCIGHTYDTPQDDIYKCVSLNDLFKELEANLQAEITSRGIDNTNN